MLAWKAAAKRLRDELRTARGRWQFWEGMAKGRVDKRAMQELDVVKLDAFTGWMSARILSLALRDALTNGIFDLETRSRLEKDLAKVRIEDPSQYMEQ